MYQSKSMFTDYKSYFTDVMKEIGIGAKKQREEAAKHVKEKIKQKAIAMKKTGNLSRGVYIKNTKNTSFIGLRSPAYHAYLIEFGHLARDKKTFVPGRPIVYPTFNEESGNIQRILSEPWVK